jgi:uncharacterized protein
MIRALLLFLVLAVAAPAQAQTYPALTGRVVDRANLLSPAEEAGLTARLAALEARTTDQFVIVTIPSLDGRTIEDFGLGLGNHWHIGRRGSDNGVLIIVAPAEHKVRIEVGRGLEAILTDARAHEIIQRDMLPALRQSRWYPAVEAGTRRIIETLIAHRGEPRRARQ